ncbi:helix-turn-helix domain-containing protein [Streptomyces sp. NPDC056660]|uniref:helix-turn-helix domain-containing protein n=1 Tax=Streptomyces sp. NPDC056660 TaxID=3345897 RepID=UPI00368314C3
MTSSAAPCSFGAPRNRLVVPQAWINRPMPGRDPVTYASTLELLEAQMASRRRQQDLLEVLEISVAQSLPVVRSFSEQARRHASSERTLRRLADCGTSYEAIVEGVRRERVEQLLHRPHLTVREVARQTGFSDERALRRAVRRWHGMAPSQLREGFLSGDGGNDATSGAGPHRIHGYHRVSATCRNRPRRGPHTSEPSTRSKEAWAVADGSLSGQWAIGVRRHRRLDGTGLVHDGSPVTGRVRSGVLLWADPAPRSAATPK